jgi:hypothetical protein
VAGVVGYAVTGALIEDGVSTYWRRPFFVFGGIMAMMVIILYFVLPSQPRYQSGCLITTSTTSNSSDTEPLLNPHVEATTIAVPSGDDGRHEQAPINHVIKTSLPVWYISPTQLLTFVL